MEQMIGNYAYMVMASGFLTLILGTYTFLIVRGSPGVKSYFAMTIASFIYAIAYALVLSSSDLDTIKLLIKIEYIGLPFIPVFCLLMCIQYTGMDKYIKPSVVLLLFVIPFLSIISHYTNEYHHLFYSAIDLNHYGSSVIVVLKKGPIFLIYSGYSFATMIAGVLLLLTRWKGSHIYTRLQIISMTIGLVTPVIASLVYLVGLSPLGLDLAPGLMGVSCLFQGAAILSFGMFNIVPVIKDTVFESMRDGVLVLDKSNRLIDYNGAATRMFPVIEQDSLGQKIDLFMKDFPQILNWFNEFYDQSELDFHYENKNCYYNLRFSCLLSKKGEAIGKIILIYDVTEKTVYFKKLQTLATIDGLTQVYNRTHFFELSNNKLKKFTNPTDRVSLIMFDIDNFKKINDLHGHEIGDSVIKEVARVCKERIRNTDILGRYGGEEFVIFMPETNKLEARKQAEILRRAIEGISVQTPSGSLSVTASFGVCDVSNYQKQMLNIESLIKEADRMLYEAKKNGRNNVQYSSI